MTITRALLAVAATGLLLSLSACLTPQQLELLQRDVDEIRSQVGDVRAEQSRQAEEIRRLRQDLEGDSSMEQEQRADLELRLRTLEDQTRVALEKGDEAGRRLEAVTSELASIRSALAARPPAIRPLPGLEPSEPGEPPSPAGGVPPGSTTASPNDLFNSSYADYSKGNYPLAIRGFEEFLRSFPSSDLADNARYWIGICHYDAGEYSRAIEEFDRLLADYPDGDKVPAAHLKKGLAYLEMNRPAQGVVQLQYLIENYPDSDEARVARERLRSMGVRTG